ncbi:MAG: PQQ-binding-like beta-propeller repeat protein [Verrucomicrobiota bacterium]
MAASLIATTLSAADVAATWLQWRGPTRDGLVTGTKWPEKLDAEHLKQTWRVPLGPSYSGTVVTADKVFTTETKDKKFEVVHAYDRKTGKELWTAQWEGSLSVPFFAKANGDWIRSTPACDGETLYVAGMKDLLVALEVQTGKEKWRVDFMKEFKTPLPSFGFVSSPLIDGEAIYVQAGAGVVKLDKRTGKVLWRSLQDEGGMWGSAFSSPILAELCGQRQLVVQTRTALAGLEPTTGAVLWTQPVEAFRGMNILTPTVIGDGVFTSTYGGKTLFFEVSKKDGSYSLKQKWENKSQGYMSTPVIIDGHAYHHLRSQRAVCIDLATGQEKWVSGSGYGKYWSLVANGDRVLALDQVGKLHLFKATPEKFEVLDSRKLGDAEMWAHLTVAGQEIYVREQNALVAYRWE